MSTPTVKPRRKPLQSRAWMTSGAIQDAFVMLLVERGYDKVSMREIAAVAGVGLGTLYLYFPGKESIAAVTVRSWMRKQAAVLAAAARTPAPRTLQATVQALAAAHVQALLGQAGEWRALLELERRISPPERYREIYREFVLLFRDALGAATDWPAALDLQRTAFNGFTILHGLAKQALLVQETCPPADELLADVTLAVGAYFRAAEAG
ncbi:TetR/AcrR family transcriptional regulator [Aquabacterium sp.]|uniref:TetR/AcrR family transcriptional regulator n=1 Tax=Aquabacterium sp. TaxID=1872578 RepID=UPI002BB1C153|nr:helix-turn-helix domain-containing protein [Aquabacterium sp.]HSW08788.1 helix-turn-helix domain-containing protein [Aquabacterium sp.]